MNYAVFIVQKAQGELSRLPLAVYDDVKDTMTALGEPPRPRGCKKLTGREGWRIRVGSTGWCTRSMTTETSSPCCT